MEKSCDFDYRIEQAFTEIIIKKIKSNMKTSAVIIALTLFAVASAAESSSGALANHWSTLPSFLVNYYWQPMDFLIAYFWKWIQYGTFFVLIEQVYCNFFSTALETLLASQLASVLDNTFAFGTDPDVTCKYYFWLYFDSIYYAGDYNDRPFPTV